MLLSDRLVTTVRVSVSRAMVRGDGSVSPPNLEGVAYTIREGSGIAKSPVATCPPMMVANSHFQAFVTTLRSTAH